MTLDALIEKAKAARKEPHYVVGSWTPAVSLSPEVVIALCEVAKAARTMTWARQHKNDSWRTYKRIREALAHLDDVLGEK